MDATATDLLLYRRWGDLAVKKRKEAYKQVPINGLFKE
jgi:hypothetical protein